MTWKEFYVYELIDPRDGKPFYIGKGKGARILRHEWEAKRGIYSRKCNRIRDIWAAGLQVVRRTILEFKSETCAYSFEAAKIASIGLGNLTNVISGGGGAPSTPKPQKPAQRPKWTKMDFYKIFPSLWRATRLMGRGDGHLYVFTGFDVTEVWFAQICEFIEDIGSDFVFERLDIETIVWML